MAQDNQTERTTPDKEYAPPGRNKTQLFYLAKGEWMYCAVSTKRCHRGPQRVTRTIYLDGGITDASERNPSYL